MTEDEAKAKACHVGPNRPADNGPCIGSACMAWQWTVGTLEILQKAEENGVRPEDMASDGFKFAGIASVGVFGSPNWYQFTRPWAPGQRAGRCGRIRRGDYED